MMAWKGLILVFVTAFAFTGFAWEDPGVITQPQVSHDPLTEEQEYMDLRRERQAFLIARQQQDVVLTEEEEMRQLRREHRAFLLARERNGTLLLETSFDRIPADTTMSTGQSVANDCQDPAAGHPYTPFDWPDASATLSLEQGAASTWITLEIAEARPNTYFTIWLRLKGNDASGNSYGGSPLTGAPSTALIPSSELPEALEATGSGNGGTDLSNGFWTDASGDAIFRTELDFPVIDGAYPFQRFEGFDPSDERFPVEDPRIFPVAIVGSGAPFTLRIASHCTDSLGHGLVPGPHEGWFQWLVDPN